MDKPKVKKYDNLFQNMKKPGLSYDAMIEVYYLEAPLGLLPQKLVRGKSITEKLVTPNAYHTGVGFRAVQRGKDDLEFVCDLVAAAFGPLVFLPIIDDSGNLQWFNQAVVTYYPIIDRTYWSKSTLICKISRDVLYDAIDWVRNVYIPNNPAYVMISITKNSSPESLYNPYNRSCICDDFCYGVFGYLQDRKGIAIQYVTVPDYTVIALTVGNQSNISQMDLNDPEQKQMVVGFYQAIDNILGDVLAYAMAGNPAARQQAWQQLMKDLEAVAGEISAVVKTKIMNLVKQFEYDFNMILGQIKTGPTDKATKAQDIQLINAAWTALGQKKNAANLGALLKTIGEYLKDSGVTDAEINALLGDAVQFKYLIPDLMSGFKNLIYYGYDKGNKMQYFLIRGNKGLYVNYIETDLTRDRLVYNLGGNLVGDVYTVKNNDRKLISNYNCAKMNSWLYLLIIVLLVLAVLFLVLWLTKRPKKKALV